MDIIRPSYAKTSTVISRNALINPRAFARHKATSENRTMRLYKKSSHTHKAQWKAEKRNN